MEFTAPSEGIFGNVLKSAVMYCFVAQFRPSRLIRENKTLVKAKARLRRVCGVANVIW